jgi:hypothetical protein
MRLASHTIPNRRHRPRLVAGCAVAVILVTAWSSIPATALAQSGPLPQTNGLGPLPAPIGHRQPRAQDLPPDVLRDEGMSRQPSEPAPTMRPDASRDQGYRRAGRMPSIDDDLQICRGC